MDLLLKKARVGDPSLQTDLPQGFGVFLVPILWSVPGSIHGQKELPTEALLAWLEVFLWDPHVYRPRRLGVEIGSANVGVKEFVILTASGHFV